MLKFSPADEKDMRIMECFIRDWRVSVAAIAKITEIPESTVQKRVAELVNQKRIERVVRVVDWAAAGYTLAYRLDIEVNQENLSMGIGGPVSDGTVRVA